MNQPKINGGSFAGLKPAVIVYDKIPTAGIDEVKLPEDISNP
jgi:hypothetical protein